MTARALFCGAIAFGAALVTACLPGDTRPVPGSAYVTASSSDATAHGLTTSDGWAVTLDRLLVGLGNVDLDGDACASYGEAHYTKLFDFADPGAAAAPQKVGLIYGLGACAVKLDLRKPSDDAPLTVGVTSGDVAFMDVEAMDAFVATNEGAVVYAVGHATKGGATKRFAWLVRQRFDLHDCPADMDGGVATALDLAADDAVTLDLSIHGEELFRASLDEGAELRFDAIADADADGDGEVTLDELALAPAPVTQADTDAGIVTLADLVYLGLTARLAQMAGGPCVADLHQPHD